MKSLNMYLGSVIDNDDVHFESLLDDDDIFLDPENDKNVIEDWIKNNYIITGKLTVDGLAVNCTGDVTVKNALITSLTNGFKWDKVGGDFDCSYCENIRSLKGAPKEVGRNFYCSDCDNLTSLEGAPEYVGGCFDCNGCKKLASLEGAPKEVDEYFDCDGCENLNSRRCHKRDWKRFLLSQMQ